MINPVPSVGWLAKDLSFEREREREREREKHVFEVIVTHIQDRVNTNK